MAVKAKEYLFSINEFKEPKKVKDNQAIATLIVRLFLMEKGTNPLHPDMGIDIKSFRFGMNNIGAMQREIERQIQTYIPNFQTATINIIVNKDKTCNIEIHNDNKVFVYNSDTAPVPITLTDIGNK